LWNDLQRNVYATVAVHPTRWGKVKKLVSEGITSKSGLAQSLALLEYDKYGRDWIIQCFGSTKAHCSLSNVCYASSFENSAPANAFVAQAPSTTTTTSSRSSGSSSSASSSSTLLYRIIEPNEVTKLAKLKLDTLGALYARIIQHPNWRPHQEMNQVQLARLICSQETNAMPQTLHMPRPALSQNSPFKALKEAAEAKNKSTRTTASELKAQLRQKGMTGKLNTSKLHLRMYRL